MGKRERRLPPEDSETRERDPLPSPSPSLSLGRQPARAGANGWCRALGQSLTAFLGPILKPERDLSVLCEERCGPWPGKEVAWALASRTQGTSAPEPVKQWRGDRERARPPWHAPSRLALSSAGIGDFPGQRCDPSTASG